MTETATPSPSGSTAGSRLVGIAHKEFRSGVRSTGVRIIFSCVVASTLLIYWAVGRMDDAAVVSAVGFLGLPFQLLVPVAAITLGSTSVSGEREAGSLKLLLGLPPSRAEVVVGKLLGASAVLLVGLAGTFVVAAVLGVAVFGRGGLGTLVGVVAATVLLGVAFLGLSVGLSASVSTAKRSMAAGFGVFLGLTFLWEPVVAGVYFLVEGTVPEGGVPPWLSAVERLNPIEAYAVVANMMSDAGVTPLRISTGVVGGPSTAAEAGASVPFLLTEQLGIVVLCGWLAIPVALGTRRFQRSDLA